MPLLHNTVGGRFQMQGFIPPSKPGVRAVRLALGSALIFWHLWRSREAQTGKNMRIWTVTAAALAAAAISTLPARANDSAAAIGQGGLELVQQGDVAMVSEDLYVSVPKIRVKYEFRNEGAAPVKTLVAFPLPEYDLRDIEGNVGWPSDNQIDPTGFKVTVDGKPIKSKVEAKAFVGTKDVTKDLADAGVPVMYPFGDFWDRVKKIKRAQVDKLLKAGIVERLEGSDEIQPKWRIKSAHYWDMTFPPGRIVKVEHEYAPVNGGSFWSEGFLKTEAEAAKDEFFRDFCLDQATLDAIAKKLAASKAVNGPSMLSYIDIRYILKTGRNWKGPIGKFKLTVDKGAPANLVSFCASGVTKTGPTTFVVEKSNWEPDRDLSVLVLQSMQ